MGRTQPTLAKVASLVRRDFVAKGTEVRVGIDELEDCQPHSLNLIAWLNLRRVRAEPVVQIGQQFSNALSYVLFEYWDDRAWHASIGLNRPLQSFLGVCSIQIELKGVRKTS